MNEHLLKLLELIEKYSEGGVLREEFEAFSGYDEPIETIEDLIEAMESEMEYSALYDEYSQSACGSEWKGYAAFHGRKRGRPGNRSLS